MAKTEKRKLKDKLEKIVKKIVKERDNYTCQKCGKFVEGVNCHASHVIPVSRDGRLAFDPLNRPIVFQIFGSPPLIAVTMLFLFNGLIKLVQGSY